VNVSARAATYCSASVLIKRIDLPTAAMDDVCTVFKVEFDEPIKLVPLNDKTRSVGGG